MWRASSLFSEYMFKSFLFLCVCCCVGLVIPVECGGIVTIYQGGGCPNSGCSCFCCPGICVGPFYVGAVTGNCTLGNCMQSYPKDCTVLVEVRPNQVVAMTAFTEGSCVTVGSYSVNATCSQPAGNWSGSVYNQGQCAAGGVFGTGVNVPVDVCETIPLSFGVPRSGPTSVIVQCTADPANGAQSSSATHTLAEIHSAITSIVVAATVTVVVAFVSKAF